MDSAQRRALARHVLSLSRADQTEVTVWSERSALTRFTHNAVHQNVSSEDLAVNVRAVVGNRTGVASTNLLEEAALRAAVQRAIAIARLAPADEALPPLPAGRAEPAPSGAHAVQTANASPQTRARMAEAIFQSADRAGCWCAGFVKTAECGIAIVNTSGTDSTFDGTDAAVNVKMNAADSTGYAEGFDTNVERLDGGAIGERSAAIARTSAEPSAVDPGEWTVILEPAAFGELFMYLSAHFSAQSFDEGSSFLSDGLGRRYFAPSITIADDYAHPLAPGMPFDYEGYPTQRLTLVDRGVAKTVVTDSYWANKLSRPNTGHALPAPNAYGPQARHLVVAPGEQTRDELIAQTKRGLLVTRFWYIRTVDQKRAIVTGMTRDGTFLIENGRIARGVHNMRFNQSIIDALARCVPARGLARTGSYSYSVVVPAVKIERFRFSSVTAF